MKHLSLSLPMIILISLLNVNSLMGQVKWNNHLIADRIAAQNKAAISKDGKHAITVGYMNTYYTCSDASITDPFNKSLSWKKGTIDGFSNLTSVAYFSNQGIIISNDEGMLFRSTDHGLEWSTIELEKDVRITCIQHIQDSILLTSTVNGSIFRSTDSGLSWALVQKVEFGLNDLSFGKNGSVLAIGQKGLILESKDLGKTWKKTVEQAPDSVNLISVSYVYDSTWVIAGDTSYLARTTNNGNSWNYIITDTSNKKRKYYVSFTSFTDNGIGVIIDYNMVVPIANIFFTWDGGKTWKPGSNIYFDGIPDIHQITDIQFFSGSLFGIVSGASDRVSSIRIIKDSLPYAYERMPIVTWRGNTYSPSNFYVSSGNTTYFRTVDTLRKQFLREHDLTGKVVKEWRFADSSSRYKYVSAQ
ncbi:MAG: YCF48-related protein [Ignavibacteriae bacterium]|nr:YCF48-related protein [Ignavibacteriota bacterium]